jgi:N-acetylglucosamine malate deacetylase 1
VARSYLGTARSVKKKTLSVDSAQGLPALRASFGRRNNTCKNGGLSKLKVNQTGALHAALGADLLESAPEGASMKLDLLAIAAHPDDVELTCGGTMLKMARRGYKTGILDLTAGEMGTRGTPETRAKEAAKAAKLLGVAWRGTLGVPDSDVHPARQHKLKLASTIRDLRPRTVILPYWQARHPDHYHASTLGYEGCFLAGLKQLPIEGEPYRPFKILYSTSYADVRPTFVVDITKEFERRRKAILAFGSQFRPAKRTAESKVVLAIDRLEDEMNQLARHYGQMIGVKYGEPFLTKELMQVEDVVDLDVRSI